LVTEDVALLEECAEHLVQVQVRAADAARGDADDRVGVLLDRRVGDGVPPHVSPAVPCQCLHRALSFAVDGRAGTTAPASRNVGLIDSTPPRARTSGCWSGFGVYAPAYPNIVIRYFACAPRAPGRTLASRGPERPPAEACSRR